MVPNYNSNQKLTSISSNFPKLQRPHLLKMEFVSRNKNSGIIDKFNETLQTSATKLDDVINKDVTLPDNIPDSKDISIDEIDP